MSNDWFDPFGVRGSRLDPFTVFGNVLKGQGATGQSAELLSRTIVRRIVGRTVHVEAGTGITATIAAVDEARPPAPLAALPTGSAEVPLWERVRIRLVSIGVGDRRVAHATLDVHDIRLVGMTGREVRVGSTAFVASIGHDEVVRWAAEAGGDRRVRAHAGRLEVTDRRLRRWVWVEVDVGARDRTLFVSPVALRAFGHVLTLPRWLRRTVSRPAGWLPASLRVERVEVGAREVEVTGSVGDVVVPVDLARLLTDLGTESTRSVLRIVTGDR